MVHCPCVVAFNHPFCFLQYIWKGLYDALSTEGHDTHLTTTLAHNLKVGGGGVGSTMAGKAIGNQVEIHVKYGAEPTVKGAFPAQGMTYVVDLVAPGLRICGQVTYFGLLLSASNPVTMLSMRLARGWIEPVDIKETAGVRTV